MLWVDQFSPTKIDEYVGAEVRACVRRLYEWFVNWQPGNRKTSAAFVWGPSGVGKTSAAHLCAKLAGYADVVENNASDQRTRKQMAARLDALSVSSADDPFAGLTNQSPARQCLVFDEVDGLTNDGVAFVVDVISRATLPVVCISNAPPVPAFRAVVCAATTLAFQRPSVNEIVALGARLTGLDQQQHRRLAACGNVRAYLNALQFGAQASGTLDATDAEEGGALKFEYSEFHGDDIEALSAALDKRANDDAFSRRYQRGPQLLPAAASAAAALIDQHTAQAFRLGTAADRETIVFYFIEQIIGAILRRAVFQHATSTAYAAELQRDLVALIAYLQAYDQRPESVLRWLVHEALVPLPLSPLQTQHAQFLLSSESLFGVTTSGGGFVSQLERQQGYAVQMKTTTMTTTSGRKRKRLEALKAQEEK